MTFEPFRLLGIVLARKPWRLKSAGLRARAEQLRRARDFPGAIILYRQYLELRPDHAVAWMLFGHCLKENGQLAEADQAYAEALRLDPRHRDASVARAHFLKTLGRRAEAYREFGRAVALGAGTQARLERDALEELGDTPADDAGAGQARLWIDISDLLDYMAQHRNVSGIQRVQVALVAYALAHPDKACIVLTRPWHTRVYSISRRMLVELLAISKRGDGGGPAMEAVLRQLWGSVAREELRHGCTLFQAGAFWIGNGNPPLHWAARRAGMRPTALIHDLFPIQMPEVCHAENVRDFRAALAELLPVTDALLSNSAFSARSVHDLLTAKGLPPLTVTPVPLAHGEPAGPLAQPHWSPAIAPLRGRDFVLAVGTVEPRKNHVFLIRLWQRMVEAGDDPPPLVLVGKMGWMTGVFEAAMADSRAAQGRIIHLRQVSDPELETLYGACLFTTFPSLMEGWGLPVGESLARGKLCVTSNRGALPEVGGDFAVYADVDDIDTALPVYRRMIFDRPWREAAEARLRQGFQPRHWDEVAADMVAALHAMRPTVGQPLQGPRLPPDTPYLPRPIASDGHGTAPGLDVFPHPLRLMLADGWLIPTLEGVAMAEARAWLHLVAEQPGTLRLELRALWPQTIRAGHRFLHLDAGEDGRLDVPVAAGPIDLRLEVEGWKGTGTPGIQLLGVELRSAHVVDPTSD